MQNNHEMTKRERYFLNKLFSIIEALYLVFRCDEKKLKGKPTNEQTIKNS